MNLQQIDAEQAATEYATGLGTLPFVIEGCELDETTERPFWKVFLTFNLPSQEGVGVTDWLIVSVDAMTGESSHVDHL